MDKLLKLLDKVLPHLTIIMSIMMLVFFLIDRANSYNTFMENEFHKWLALGLLVCGSASAIKLIARQRKD
ncbi:MAG: hypothetical protein PHI27_02065 [Eubacteriales bacterium]|nr:hypothetical protein [Eubacteriales bacterium]MDD4511913.1 hypothetical protein [Eubacteriales bacterium]